MVIKGEREEGREVPLTKGEDGCPNGALDIYIREDTGKTGMVGGRGAYSGGSRCTGSSDGRLLNTAFKQTLANTRDELRSNLSIV